MRTLKQQCSINYFLKYFSQHFLCSLHVGGCEGGGPGEVCVINEHIRPLLHLCSWTMLDGLMCGRKHSHLDHRDAMKDLRYDRVVRAAAADHKGGAPALFAVSANQNVWLQSAKGQLWAQLRSQATQERLSFTDQGVPYTQYSTDGISWSEEYYDRSDAGTDQEDDSQSDSLLSSSGEVQSSSEPDTSQSSPSALSSSLSEAQSTDSEVSPAK